MSYFSDYSQVAGVDLPDLDITNRTAVRKLITLIRPSVVIHAAAYTDVDGCESNEGQAMAVNADGTENIAKACREVGAVMVYYSTDYVFDGCKPAPYVEDDAPNPQTAYGRSKLAGEERVRSIVDNHVIMRIAWVYGANGRNFVKTIVRLGREYEENVNRKMPAAPLQVVSDQIGNPTCTSDIVRQTEQILQTGLFGIFHSSSERPVSWYEFTRAVFEELEMTVDVRPCTSEEFKRPAKRPANSALENARLKEARINVMRDYREALIAFLEVNKEKILQ
jgi:dTDP-4-dehydrorhamnose reductase